MGLPLIIMHLMYMSHLLSGANGVTFDNNASDVHCTCSTDCLGQMRLPSIIMHLMYNVHVALIVRGE